MTEHEKKAREIACSFASQGAIYDCRDGEHNMACNELTVIIAAALDEAVKAEREVLCAEFRSKSAELDSMATRYAGSHREFDRDHAGVLWKQAQGWRHAEEFIRSRDEK